METNNNDNMSKAAFYAVLEKFGFKPVTLLVPGGEQKVMCYKVADEREGGNGEKITVKAHIYMSMSEDGIIDFKVCTLKDLVEMGFVEESLSSTYFYPHQTAVWQNHVTCIEQYFSDMDNYVAFITMVINMSIYDLHMAGEFYFWQAMSKNCLKLSDKFHVGLNVMEVHEIMQDRLGNNK